MEGVIQKKDGACVVLAGAGTGKTYTIVEKIKYIIKNKICNPEKIVCITFSNEAANNLILRIDRALENFDKEHRPVIRTFHGFSADLLRKYGDRIGIKSDFRILDPDQAKVILHRNLKVNAGNCHKYIGAIGTIKDLGIRIEDFNNYLERELKRYDGVDLDKRLENLQFEFQVLHLNEAGQKKKQLVSEITSLKNLLEIKKFVNAWNAYEKLKKKGNYQDYSDLNNNALELLDKNPDVGGNFECVIVDEFQDTNKLQLEFLVKLARHGNITVVGDVNQSIYRFRGAYKENLSIFKRLFGITEKDIFNLAKSYRSPDKILRTAHKLISNNYENKDECFLVENAHSREGDKIEVYEMKNSKEEARKVAELILRESENGVPMEEICVMFRTHQQGRVIRKVLDEAGIPYSSVSKASLLKQKSIKTAHDYLVILDKLKRKDSGGEEAWWDLVYQLDFVPEDLIRIGRVIRDFNKNKTEVKVSAYLFNSLGSLDLSESGRMASKILIEKIKGMLEFINQPISSLVREVYRISGLVNDQRTRDEKEIMLNLNKFYELAKMHEEFYDSDLSNFLYYLQVLESLGIEIEASQLEESGVRLMTSHSTKGLEYKVVIITNMAQGRFPIERYIGNSFIPTELLPEVRGEIKQLGKDEREEFIMSYEKHHQLLEERRLAYVSFTRAKEKLIITFAEEYNNKKVSPSRFLNEINFEHNEDIVFSKDNEEKYSEPEIEIRKASEISVLGSNKFEQILLEKASEIKTEEHKKFSPSALLAFDECQKQFEYKYVYNMPEKKSLSWEAMRMGSFVHLVLEKGVSSGFTKVEEFLTLARSMTMEEDWQTIELNEAETLIRVFFERNKEKYNEKSKTEQYLPLKLAGMDFIGFADRIDFNSDGSVDIIDYKTGKTSITPKARNWQLGFYALAAKEKYGNVKKVILDMLKQEKPIEFEINDRGEAVCLSSDRMSGFNIYEVEQELIKTAHRVQQAYKNGFKACPIEKNCDFCNEYVYNL